MNSQLLNEEIQINSFFTCEKIKQTLNGQKFGHGSISDWVVSQLRKN